MTSLPDAAALLGFESRLRAARSAREVDFLVANETFELIRFDQALLWRPGLGGRPALAAVSGLAEVDPQSPFAHWFSRAIASLSRPDGSIASFDAEQFPAELDDGAEWIPAHLALIPFSSPTEEDVGGLWLSRQEPFSEDELKLAQWIGQTAGYALWAWQRDRIDWKGRLARLLPERWHRQTKVQKRLVLAGLGLILLFPIRMSALAPAEVTPAKPIPITAPVDGVVSQILVAPNQQVAPGTPLLEIDDTATRNRLAVAAKTLDTARADYARAASKAFSDDASKAELQLLEARIKERTAELAFHNELLGRLKPTAPVPGIALFADAEEWRGRPVQTGERIMTVADPAQAALTIYLSPDDAISLDSGAYVRMYLNVSPLSSYEAVVTQASYEIGTAPEGQPAYVVKAAFAPGETPPRLGLKGTAKVYGNWTTLAYYVMRKPLRGLRRALGV